MSRLFAILLVAATACGSTERTHAAPPDTTPPSVEGGASTDTTAPPAPEPPTPAAPLDPTATASPPPTASPVPAQEIDAAFPPLEDACKVDSDCAPTEFAVGPKVLCCSGCGGVAGTKAWVAKAAAVCNQRQAAKKVGPCPPWDCAQPVARCESGRCTQR